MLLSDCAKDTHHSNVAQAVSSRKPMPRRSTSDLPDLTASTRSGCTKAIVFVAVVLALATLLGACRAEKRGDALAAAIRSDPRLAAVITKAETVVHGSLNAGNH